MHYLICSSTEKKNETKNKKKKTMQELLWRKARQIMMRGRRKVALDTHVMSLRASAECNQICDLAIEQLKQFAVIDNCLPGEVSLDDDET